MESLPNYANMSLVELKQYAKGRRIKQYYIMKRQQLIELLSLTELPQRLKIDKMTIHQLRDEAKNRGMRGFWNLRRERLVEILYPANGMQGFRETTADQNDEDEGKTYEHHEPQKHDAKNVGVENGKHTIEQGAKNV